MGYLKQQAKNLIESFRPGKNYFFAAITDFSFITAILLLNEAIIKFLTKKAQTTDGLNLPTISSLAQEGLLQNLRLAKKQPVRNLDNTNNIFNNNSNTLLADKITYMAVSDRRRKKTEKPVEIRAGKPDIRNNAGSADLSCANICARTTPTHNIPVINTVLFHLHLPGKLFPGKNKEIAEKHERSIHEKPKNTLVHTAINRAFGDVTNNSNNNQLDKQHPRTTITCKPGNLCHVLPMVKVLHAINHKE